MSERPFYGSFAWAYDLLAERPVARECGWVAAALSARGVGRGARMLDAGCATGRYALALVEHGYRVTGVDRSPELIAVARQRGVRCVIADLVTLPVRRAFGAVLCRGVLNDVLDDVSRRVIFRALAGALSEGGVLILDVRDWDATVQRKGIAPVHERAVDTEHGRLIFRSEARLDAATRRMLIAECHVLVRGGETATATHDFVMRCWTRGELEERLREAGFASVECHGAYDDAVPLGATDRIVAVAGMLKP